MRNVTTNQNYMENFHQNAEKFQEISKISINIKNCKTFCKGQPPLPQPDKILLRIWNKNSLRRYTKKYRRLLSKCFKNPILGRQEMM